MTRSPDNHFAALLYVDFPEVAELQPPDSNVNQTTTSIFES